MTKVCTWKRFKDEEVSDEIWEDIEPILIEEYPWDDNGYKPKVEVRFFYTEDKLYLKFTAYEEEIRTIYKNMNDPVYTDSCVEFFFNPDPDEDNRYFNFEINAIGTLLLEWGENRKDRVELEGTTMDIFNIKSSVDRDKASEYNEESWDLELSIPYGFIEKYYGKQDFSSGKKMKGNFQKCGDQTKYPHFGCWNRIDIPQGDFHRPDFFGDLVLE